MSHHPQAITRVLDAYARLLVRFPGRVLAFLVLLGIGSTWLTSKLTIEPNQLDLISQDLPEVKELKRIIDMVGGAGYLVMALRSEDEKLLKKTADDLNELLLKEKESVRFITYKVPVEFIQENMVLFIKTEDLAEAKRRINLYLRDQLRRANPFFIEIRKTEPVKLELDDLVDKYSRVGDKSIRDDYYISQDRQVTLLLIKPMWNSTELNRTKEFIDRMKVLFAEYQAKSGTQLEEKYEVVGKGKQVLYGFTGSYKTSMDDSLAIQQSLDDVLLVALLGILVVTIAFFRKIAPTVIVITGTTLGTVVTMGFTKLTVGELNMVTSILGAILMGFGVDYGIHFIFRTRIELGLGKRYDAAIHDALVNAGRPALIAAIVTAGSFFVLLVSEFRGFSQFGFLAGAGTILIGLTLFSWSPCILLLAGRKNPDWPAKLIGTMEPPKSFHAGGELRVPHPKLVLGIAGVVVGLLCAFAVPWQDFPLPKDRPPTMLERLKAGVRFDYNTRALMPDNYPSIVQQDEINRRFKISSDPLGVYTKGLEDARVLYDELTNHADKYPSVRQVVSIYSFVPPAETAAANAKILAEWKEELKDIEVASLPPEVQEKAQLFLKMLDAKPFDVHGVPAIYADIFKSLPTTKPENQGMLTFIYSGVDLWDGKKMLEFSDQVSTIRADNGQEFHGSGLPILYAKLARIVLADGKLTVLLTTIWILVMHFLDFRSVKLALASVLPLIIGLVMMLGLMSMTNHRLNFMNIIILPILLGFGVSHGLYLLHRFLEGTSPMVALRSVGAAVASSTLTAIVGFGSLMAAGHNGLKSMGYIACLGLFTTLVVSFTVLAAVLQLIHDGRMTARTAIDPLDEVVQSK